MFKSIRWTLQLWYALLLLAVVCIFGGTLYYKLREARFESIDAELQGQAETLAARIFLGPPIRRDDGSSTRPATRPADFGPEGPRRGGGPPPLRDEGPATQPQFGPDGPGRGGRQTSPGVRPEPPPDEPPQRGGGRGGFDGGFRGGRGGRGGPGGPGDFGGPGGPGGPGGGGGRGAEVREIELPEPLLRRYEGDEENVPYFAIFRPSGQLGRASRTDLDIPSPGRRIPNSPPQQPFWRQRDHLREVVVQANFQPLTVVVGRSIEKDVSELKHLLVLLAATGAAVMFVGLVGGWLISNRAIDPIRAITATTQNISASNLSQRINASQIKSELGSLAEVLNAMFARLEGAFDRQVRFTADASHELRTPLSIVYSHAELALAKERTADEYRAAIETCFRASKRMKSLVESLLVLARADAGKLDIKCEQFDLKSAVEDCAALVGPLAADRKVQLRQDLQSVPLCGDTFRIAQVITNLLTNAINYNREGGSVSVYVKADGSDAMLTVADTGVGIAEEDQKHLFERFYRVDKARSRELGGSGLGLAICKSIVEAHGGSIACTSKAGQGTTFIVRLPRRQDALDRRSERGQRSLPATENSSPCPLPGVPGRG